MDVFLLATRSLLRLRVPPRYAISTEWEWDISPTNPDAPAVLSVWKRTNRLDPPFRYTATAEESQLFSRLLSDALRQRTNVRPKNECDGA